MSREFDAQSDDEHQEVEVIQSRETFVGPLPPPWIIREYKELYENAPEIIFNEFQNEAKHRRQIERGIASSEVYIRVLGQFVVYGIAISGLIVSWFAFERGYPWQAVSIIGVVGGGIIARLIKSRNTNP